MADTEGESPAQRQARIRREKREAKITAGGSQRLDKIIGVSGRDPELGQYAPAALSRHSTDDTTVKKETASPGDSPAPSAPQAQGTPPPMPPLASTDDPAQARAQEEYLRSLLRSQEPQQGAGDGPQDEDPMMKMLNSILGGGDPNNPTAGLPFSPEDIKKATGLPSFVTDMIFGSQKAPPTPAQEQSTRIWTMIHYLFSILAGLYVVRMVSYSVQEFGTNPPAPPTFQNPFLLFVMGELLVQGTRIVAVDRAGPKGAWAWWQILKNVGRDGSIVVFMLGIATWWRGSG